MVYNDEVRKFVEGLGVEKISKRLVNSREGPPVFEQPEMTLEKLMEYGNMLVMEKENVKRIQLADQYFNETALGENVKRVQLHCVTCVAGKSDVTDPAAKNFDPIARSD
ncbi:ribulose bisphosphate carboxylase/oxygenase activase, chloroplastic-like [Brassica napus]|nr:ribulose bisphosphate carboxylase/oxygenase activase, chloroplastic-like [Brassica napus]